MRIIRDAQGKQRSQTLSRVRNAAGDQVQRVVEQAIRAPRVQEYL